MRGTRGGAAELFQGEIIRRSPKEGGEEHRTKKKGERTISECRRMSIGEEWERTGWRGWQQ